MLALRSLLFNIAFFTSAGLAGLIGLPLLFGPKRWRNAGMRGTARMELWLLKLICGIDIRVEGQEYLPRQGAALIAAKHQSALDTIVWFGLLPDVAYVMKRELFRIPIYGWFARRAEMIGVDRSGGAQAMRALMRDGKRAVEEGRQIVIFPEGTRTSPGQQVRYQPGIVALAAATKLPVIPVATNSGLFWSRRAFTKRPGTVIVRVLPPLTEQRDELLTRLEAVIEAEQPALEGR
ncbi:lysophospholipid acyltransferase family protein [Roseococcus sp. YIM B11640]|uniref:lysophospholipid acyltransferase family protein n=1 Tax=Roseococcus sp. YIM B11640 TaxID=3133973 RepID=UPI003C7982FA